MGISPESKKAFWGQGLRWGPMSEDQYGIEKIRAKLFDLIESGADANYVTESLNDYGLPAEVADAVLGQLEILHPELFPSSPRVNSPEMGDDPAETGAPLSVRPKKIIRKSRGFKARIRRGLLGPVRSKI